MLKDNRLIGVCLTRAEDEDNITLLQALQERAVQQSARLLVFNCSLDDQQDNTDHVGEFSVFQVINYDLLDLLVIVCPAFRDKEIIQQLIGAARQHGVPVVTLFEEYAGCHAILKSYEKAFTDLLTHLIDDHGVRDLCLVADETEGEESAEKANLFRTVLNNKQLSAGNVIYCSSTDPAAGDLAERWKNAGSYPQAVVCTTDALARILCDRLQGQGCHIPGDLIVTGFGNLPSMETHTPLLTGCVRDYNRTAELIYQILNDQKRAASVHFTGKEPYQFQCAESCGCRELQPMCPRGQIAHCFHRMDRSFRHEQEAFTWADRMLSATNQADFRHELRRCLMEDSILILDKKLHTVPDDVNGDLSDLYSIYPLSVQADQERKTLPVGTMIPDLAECLADHELVLFQSIFVEDKAVGYYAACMGDLDQGIHKAYRICRILNLVFHIIDGRRRHEQMASRLVRIKSMDPVTGLLSLNGLSRYLADHYHSLSKRFIAVSVYEVDQYQQIQEDEGIDFVDQLMAMVASALSRANENAVLARISGSTFAVLDHAETHAAISSMIDAATAPFFAQLQTIRQELPMGKNTLVVHCGCVVSRPGWENNLLSFIKAATGELYLNTIKDQQQRKLGRTTYAGSDEFQLKTLLQNNYFQYHFQPIVSAHTGRIYAYEALMRTKFPVQMTPLQVLGEASRQNRLYDIEYATLFNVMDFVSTHLEELGTKRMFINTIPGYFLNDDDRRELNRRYGQYLKQCTLQITETDGIDDAQLMQLRQFDDEESPYQLAIDDYGTGFSNIVNLLRYQPQVIKIDRYLVHDVHLDTNKQLFIRSTIEFAKMNGILVLGEGVQTREELSKLIEMGVDLIQGFLVARPVPELIQAIPQDLRSFMISETLRFSRFGAQDKMYTAQDNEEIELIRIAVEKYTSVMMGSGQYHIIGQGSHYVGIPLEIQENATCRLTLQDTFIGASGPAISMGPGSTLELTLKGSNSFNYSGIRVPPDATLILCGDGDLRINSIQKRGVVLGGSGEEPCGTIVIAMTGSLNITASSENCFCIGSGQDVRKIELVSGNVTLDARGIKTVGLGSIDGAVNIMIHPKARLSVSSVGNEAVAIGSLNGVAKIVSAGEIVLRMEGEKIAGFGGVGNGNAVCELTGKLDAVMRGAHAVCIGSVYGRMDAKCDLEWMEALLEGAEVCPIGSLHGEGQAAITGGVYKLIIHSGMPGWMNGRLFISGGIFALEGDVAEFHPVSPNGDVLEASLIPAQDTGDQMIVTPNGTYAYHITHLASLPEGCIYAPKETILR